MGGANVGIVTFVENRLVGMKSRGVYEKPPGVEPYYMPLTRMERLTLDRRTLQFKQGMALKYAELV